MSYLKSATSNWRLYLIALAPAIVGYFVAVRWLQDLLTAPPVQPPDVYPGYPFLPEPYEIPLYVLGYVLIPTVAWVLLGVVRRFDAMLVAWRHAPASAFRRALVIVGIVGCVFVAGFFLRRFAHLVGEYLARRSFWDGLWLLFTKRLFIVRLSFAAAVFTFGMFIWWRRPSLEWLDRIEHSPLLPRVVPYFFLFLAAIYFHPNFPYIEGNTNIVLSPASEILHGRPLLYQTVSLYGVLNVYLTALVMALFPWATYQTFALVTMVLYFAFSCALYIMMHRISGSRTFALLSVWLGVVVGFFLLTDPYITPYDAAGQNVFRQGFYILPVLLLVLYGKTKKIYYRELMLLAAGLGLFWNTETGMYLSLATLIGIVTVEMTQYQRRLPQRLLRIVGLGFRQLGYALAVFGVITVGNYLAYGQWPGWLQQFKLLTVFEGGYGKLPMPAIGLYQGIILVYMGTISWMVHRWWQKLPIEPGISFLATYGAFSLLYYVGNSAWSYLNFISLPAVLLLVLFFHRAFYPPDGRVPNRIVAAAFMALLSFTAVMSIAKIPVVFGYRDYLRPGWVGASADDVPLYEDAQYIMRTFPDGEVPLFHRDDGILLLMANKVNWFFLSSGGQEEATLTDDSQVIFHQQIQELVDQVRAKRPPRVLVSVGLDPVLHQIDPRFVDFEDGIKSDYTVERTLNTSRVYRLRE